MARPPVSIPYKELLRYFSEDNELGEGGSSHVYKGSAPNNNRYKLPRQFAVKRMMDSRGDAILTEMEIKVLGEIRHQNIIQLIGYSKDDANNHCLVYEFMDNGDVAKNLPELGWPMTLRILREMAGVILFLHQQVPRIIYRDLKSENILLDRNFNIKLADFGLVMRGSEGRPTGGTPGSTPRTTLYGKATTQSDVFSMGILILDLLTKQHLMVYKEKLPRWVKEEGQINISKGKVGNIKNIISQKLIDDGLKVSTAKKAVLLGLRCIEQAINMEDVCQELQRLVEE